VGGVVGPIKKDIEELTQIVSEENKEKGKMLSDEIGILLESIENGTQRASQVVRKLLNLTPGRNNSNEFRTFDLSELLFDIIRLVKKSTSHISFDADIEPKVMLTGNEIEINQVILNLLRNSIQAIPEERKGEIRITLQNSILDIYLEISDNGLGMDEETTENAFNAFFTTKENGTGTGLGLFISHEIIKKHAGNIQVSSELNKGTTIAITLPVKPVPE
jgi:signal transduction histidine kinase